MSRRSRSSIPWGSLILLGTVTWVAWNVVTNPVWQAWIEANCGWLCQ